MMKRLSMLLAALFVAATLFAAPVIASGNGDDDNKDKVCVLRHKDDGKDYRYVRDVKDLRVGDKVVKDKYCKDDRNGDGDDDHKGDEG